MRWTRCSYVNFIRCGPQVICARFAWPTRVGTSDPRMQVIISWLQMVQISKVIPRLRHCQRVPPQTSMTGSYSLFCFWKLNTLPCRWRVTSSSNSARELAQWMVMEKRYSCLLVVWCNLRVHLHLVPLFQWREHPPGKTQNSLSVQ
jgi:hypothetical protein